MVSYVIFARTVTKTKRPCTKCLVRHSPPIGNKCSGPKEDIYGFAMDLAGQADSSMPVKNCKLTSMKTQALKTSKSSLQALICSQTYSYDEKSHKSVNDCNMSPSKKNQVAKWDKASVQDMISPVGSSSSDESTDESVTYMNS